MWGKKELLKLKASVQSKSFRHEADLHISSLCYCRSSAECVCILSVCRDRESCGIQWLQHQCAPMEGLSVSVRWRTGVEQGGGSVFMCVYDTSAKAQRRLSVLHYCFLHSKLTLSDLCFCCVCGLLENRVFPSEVSVRGSARSHWQSTTMLN